MSNKKHNIKIPKEDSLYIQELKFMQYIIKQSIKAKNFKGKKHTIKLLINEL